MIWEVDRFLDDNEGLIIAEVELKNETQEFIKPEWIGREISFDSKYLNCNLAIKPFKSL